jgi:hypothetical protein
MADDYLLVGDLRERIALLNADDRTVLQNCINELLRGSEPDGRTRIQVPDHFPYRINYRFASPTNHAILIIFSITPLPR